MCEVSDFRITTQTAFAHESSNDFRTSREIPLSFFLSIQYFLQNEDQTKRAFRCVKLAILERKLLFRSRVATIAMKNIKCKIVATSGHAKCVY